MIQHTYRAISNETNFVVVQFTINTKGYNEPQAATIVNRASELLHQNGSYRIERYNGANWQAAGIGITK